MVCAARPPIGTLNEAWSKLVHLEQDVELAPLTTLEVGGRARYLVRAETEADVADGLDFARANALRVWVLGGGSNVIVPDRGVDGLVLAIRLRGTRWESSSETRVRPEVAAGEPWDGVVAAAVDRGLAGIECLSGIPGLAGATPIQNVGAYGQEISDTLVSVRAYDREDRCFVLLDRAACEFAYRDSVFKSRAAERFVVTSVCFELEQGGSANLRYPELRQRFDAESPALSEVRETVLAIRRTKSMLVEAGNENRRSCGSFFLNPIVNSSSADAVAARFPGESMPRFAQPDGRVKLSAAWLIERSGLNRGLRSGNVGISSRHALSLVCHASATSDELLSFADSIRRRVEARAGVVLSLEPVRF